MLGHVLKFGRTPLNLNPHNSEDLWAKLANPPISLEGFRRYGGLSLGVCTLPQIFSVLLWWNHASDTDTFRRYKTGSDHLYHHAKFGGDRTSHAARQRKSSTFFVFFVRRAFEWQRLWTPCTSPSTRWNMDTTLVSLEKGMFVDLYPRSTLSAQRWVEPPQNNKKR